MQRKRSVSSLRSNHEGATAVEFALVASVFFFLLFSIIEYGLYMFTRVQLEDIVTIAGRQATIMSSSATAGTYGGCSVNPIDRPCIVKFVVDQQGQRLIGYQPNNANPIVTFNVQNGGNPSTFAGDLCLDCDPSGSNPHVGGACNIGLVQAAPPCTVGWQDLGGALGPGPASNYEPGAGAYSVGNSGDIIEIRVTYMWNILSPMMHAVLGVNGSGQAVVTTSTTVKNQ
jgi:hypothetical protein